jgi:hypothetical protein
VVVVVAIVVIAIVVVAIGVDIDAIGVDIDALVAIVVDWRLLAIVGDCWRLAIIASIFLIKKKIEFCGIKISIWI